MTHENGIMDSVLNCEDFEISTCFSQKHFEISTKICDFALDRITMMALTDETFEMPADFSAQAYFAEYFGVLTNDTPLAHVVLRAHKWMPNYLRTLPLHHSQRELESTAYYTDFCYDIRPTSDFLGELLRHSNGIEVLQPLDLRQKMKEMVGETLKRY